MDRSDKKKNGIKALLKIVTQSREECDQRTSFFIFMELSWKFVKMCRINRTEDREREQKEKVIYQWYITTFTFA